MEILMNNAVRNEIF